MSACAATTVYTTDQSDASLDLRDYTEAIKGADSPEAERALLAKKQAALHDRHPPRPAPDRPKQAEPVQAAESVQITDPQLRRLFERSKARGERQAARPLAVPDIWQADREPVKSTPSKAVKAVKPHPHTDPYVHGVAVKETISAVCMRPDLSSKAKSIAVMLAAHYPNIKPSMKRLKLLTGILSDKTISRALIELRGQKLADLEVRQVSSSE